MNKNGNKKNRLPAQIVQFENGKLKKSAKQIKAIKASEIQLGDQIIECPESVRMDSVALDKWNTLAELYKGFEFVTTADSDTLEQYCITYAEWLQLITTRRETLERHKKNGVGTYVSMKVLKDLGLDPQINTKSTLLQKLGARLLLDPATRCKTLPVEKQNKKKESPISRFAV